MCMEVAGDTMPTLHFIDFGNYQLVNVESIRKMPKEFTYRRVSVECALTGVGDHISPPALLVLNGVLATNAVVRIEKAEKVKSDVDEFSYIHSEQIAKMLTDAKLVF